VRGQRRSTERRRYEGTSMGGEERPAKARNAAPVHRALPG